jgi:penicillin-binding protein 1A
MAHAYETFIAHGRKVTGTLGAGDAGPVGVRRVETLGKGKLVADNRVKRIRVLPQPVADEAVSIMSTVVTQGTGKRAALGAGTFAAGKTGTTENSGDAWFVGFTDHLTVAVWVGYPDRLKPMLTDFGGAPVEGGTFPAVIWHDFMTAATTILDDREARARERKGLPPAATTTTTTPGYAPATPSSQAVPQGAGTGAPAQATPAQPSGGASSGTATPSQQTPATGNQATPAAPSAPSAAGTGTGAGGNGSGTGGTGGGTGGASAPSTP